MHAFLQHLRTQAGCALTDMEQHSAEALPVCARSVPLMSGEQNDSVYSEAVPSGPIVTLRSRNDLPIITAVY